MRPTSRWRARLVGVLVVGVAGALGACSDDEQPQIPANSVPVIVPGGPGEPASTIPPGEAEPVEPEPPNDADFAYVRDMIVHHQQALEMTAMVPERGSDEDVIGLASRIESSQGPEIDMMNRWLSSHDRPTVNPTAPGGGHGGHGGDVDHSSMPGMASPAQLDTLRDRSGPQFDTLFLQMMITHHDGALTMAGQVQTEGRDVRVQEMADEVIATQSDEIQRMRRMLGG